MHTWGSHEWTCTPLLGGKKLSNSLSRTWVPLPFPPCSLLWGHLQSTRKTGGKQGKYSSFWRQTDFTGWFSALLFYLACCGAVLGLRRFSNHEALSRPDFPLEWHISLPSNVAIVNSCLGSSNCFELYTIWINQYGINKALLFYNPSLKLCCSNF